MDSSLQRLTRKIEPTVKHSTEKQSSPFLQFLNTPNIILLGNPGAGKSHIFRESSILEGGTLLTVRQFLADKGSRCKSDILYLDALDEFRSRIDDKNLVLQVIQLLNEQGRPKFRLSCRIVDWLGESDLSLFRSYFRDDLYVVLQLEPLKESEIKQILINNNFEDTDGFIAKAQEIEALDFLTNPQNLIMLCEVVRNGSWPTSKKNLYEKFTQISLTEHNREHIKPGLGTYTFNELFDSAGASSASILISGVTGVSLLENSLSLNFPTYRSVPEADITKIQASLNRRAFSFVSTEFEAVTYVHRTTCEYLAASWICKKIRAGLPLRRVQSLIGVEGVPAPELRGLHSWMAVLLPEYASTLIDCDPYSVLTYGDPASLPIESKQALLRSLETLSETDPWFRDHDEKNENFGSLSGASMVSDFRRILHNKNASYQLKDLVLYVISSGPPLPMLEQDLQKILRDPEEGYGTRASCIEALYNAVPNCEEGIVDAFKNGLSGTPSSTRLKADILCHFYINNFKPEDLVEVCRERLDDTDDDLFGVITSVTDSVPLEDFPNILNLLTELISERDVNNSYEVCESEIELVFSRMLQKLVSSDPDITAEKLWSWLKALNHLNSDMYARNADGQIKGWLTSNVSIVYKMFKLACEDMLITEKTWRFSDIFLRTVFNSVSIEMLALWMLRVLEEKNEYSDQDYSLYEICGLSIFRVGNNAIKLFEIFCEFADGDERFKQIRDSLCFHEIEDWRREQITQQTHREMEIEKNRELNRRNLKKTRNEIESGRHLSNLAWLAKVYFGLFYNLEKGLGSTGRLAKEIGEELVPVALSGFNSVLNRENLPTVSEIVAIHIKGRHFPWWYSVMAGMDEAYKLNKDISLFSDSQLKTALCLTFLFPTYELQGSSSSLTKREWVNELYIKKPELVREVFKIVIFSELKVKKEYVNLIHTLTSGDDPMPWKQSLVFQLLSCYPSTNIGNLIPLLGAAISESDCHQRLTELAISFVSKKGKLKKEQRAAWLVTGFLLDETNFMPYIKIYLENRGWIIWIFRNLVKVVVNNQSTLLNQLSVSQIALMIDFAGTHFKNTSHPEGGWSGDRNPWDASQFIGQLISALSSIPSREATHALSCLIENNKLDSYLYTIKHALANQKVLRRSSEYKQPSWDQTVRSLAGGQPANSPDLHALVVQHLITIRKNIKTRNTNTYKRFWNTDKYGRVYRPQVEDVCRDVLVEQLKTVLEPLDIRVEPECFYVADKRADISILHSPGRKLPIEIKRDTHDDVWKSCEDQLIRLYSRDPEAEGYGIYVVLWFGKKRLGSITNPPNGISRPCSADEMEQKLNLLVPNESQNCIDVIVIDVCEPE